MYEDLAKVVENLAAAVEQKAGLPVGLHPASPKPGAGGLRAFVDAPTLEPSRTRLDGQGGQSLRLVLIGAGVDRDQVLNLYRALSRVLLAIPEEWAFPSGQVIQPVLVGDAPAFQIPLVR